MAYFEPTRSLLFYSSWKYIFYKDPYDHEIEYDNNLKDAKKLIMNLIPFGELLFLKSIAFEIIQPSLGIRTKVMIDSIPENVI